MKKVILMALLLVPMSIFAQKFGHFDYCSPKTRNK